MWDLTLKVMMQRRGEISEVVYHTTPIRDRRYVGRPDKARALHSSWCVVLLMPWDPE